MLVKITDTIAIDPYTIISIEKREFNNYTYVTVITYNSNDEIAHHYTDKTVDDILLIIKEYENASQS